jgi:hypothetical protein
MFKQSAGEAALSAAAAIPIFGCNFSASKVLLRRHNPIAFICRLLFQHGIHEFRSIIDHHRTDGTY